MKKNLYIGGYSILDLADANVYAQALICAKQNKPVLVYDDPLRYYADTIAIDTDNDNNVVITKGGKTITITDTNSVSSEGDIKIHIYQITLSGVDDDDNAIFFNAYIFTDRSDLTTENVLEFLENYRLLGSGYNLDTQVIYVYMKYETDKFVARDNGDNDEPISNIVIENLTKIQ